MLQNDYLSVVGEIGQIALPLTISPKKPRKIKQPYGYLFLEFRSYMWKN